MPAAVLDVANTTIFFSWANYTRLAAENGLVLHTTVTIGYDVPWQKAHELLIAAAGDTENILKRPPPFVLQKALNDFSIGYELNALTRRPELLPRTYSALHQHILDRFAAAGVEIMSPNYIALRDGNALTLPPAPLENQPPADGGRRTTDDKSPLANRIPPIP